MDGRNGRVAAPVAVKEVSLPGSGFAIILRLNMVVLLARENRQNREAVAVLHVVSYALLLVRNRKVASQLEPFIYSAVDGVWGNWGGWSRPSTTCGEGLYPSRSRVCNSPAPSYGGRYCKGPAVSYKNVTVRPCR